MFTLLRVQVTRPLGYNPNINCTNESFHGAKKKKIILMAYTFYSDSFRNDNMLEPVNMPFSTVKLILKVISIL